MLLLEPPNRGRDGWIRGDQSGFNQEKILTTPLFDIIVAACVWRSKLGGYVTSPKTKIAPSDRYQKPIDLERAD
jgi:hypothetical protein